MKKHVVFTLLTLLGLMSPIASSAQDAIKIRIAYPSGMNGIYPTMMERAGIAKKHGLDAEFTFFQNGPPMMEALTSGNVDVVITSMMPITSYLSKQPGKAIVVAQLGYSSHSLMVPKDSSVKTAKDLKDQRIAVSFGTDSHLDILVYLKSNGLDPGKDVKLLNTPPNELLLALNQGFADAIIIRQPQVLRMQEQFGAKIVHTWPFRFLSIMSTDFLARHPGAYKNYISALRESVLFVAQNRDQASVWFGERLRLDPKIVAQVANEDPRFTKVAGLKDVSVEITPAFQRMLDEWFKRSLELGMIKKPVELAPLKTGKLDYYHPLAEGVVKARVSTRDPS